MSLYRQSDDKTREFDHSGPSKPKDDDARHLSQAEQLRIDLEAETGYSTYGEYTAAHQVQYSKSSLFFMDLWVPPPIDYESTCFILDLSRASDSRVAFTFRCRTSSAADTLNSLRNPPAQSSVQVLLWSVCRTDLDMVTALGLGLKIDSHFFEAVYEKVIRPAQQCQGQGWNSATHRPKQCWRPFAPTYLEIDSKIITIAGHHNPVQPCSVPVVLVAGTDWRVENIFNEICDVLPLLDSVVDTTLHQNSEPPQWRRCDDEIRDYARLLHWCLRNGKKSIGSIPTLMFNALLPLVYRSTLRINDQCSQARYTYLKLLESFSSETDNLGHRNSLISDLYQQRLSLRRTVEDSEDDIENLSRYIELHAMTEWVQAFVKPSECIQRVRDAAHRLEVEIRDYLQLQAGEMGLRESRESIELSSLQIEESKRAKLLTVLAFIYVPLNLATSIFGMNIYQLNRSGQNISIFLVTALIALIATGCAWYLMEQVNSYLKWRTARLGKDDPKGTKFPFMTRINMLIWLSLSPYKYWMIKRGILWRLLTNSSARLCREEDTFVDPRFSNTAAEFASRFIRSGHITWKETDYQDWVWKLGPLRMMEETRSPHDC